MRTALLSFVAMATSATFCFAQTPKNTTLFNRDDWIVFLMDDQRGSYNCSAYTGNSTGDAFGYNMTDRGAASITIIIGERLDSIFGTRNTIMDMMIILDRQRFDLRDASVYQGSVHYQFHSNDEAKQFLSKIARTEVISIANQYGDPLHSWPAIGSTDAFASFSNCFNRIFVGSQ